MMVVMMMVEIVAMERNKINWQTSLVTVVFGTVIYIVFKIFFLEIY
jgi:hypothetical protein